MPHPWFGENTTPPFAVTVGGGGSSSIYVSVVAGTDLSALVHTSASLFLTNASMTLASNAISLSVAAGGIGGVAVGAGTNTATSGTVAFLNSNGITFGMNTGGSLTASVNTAYAGLNGAITGGSLTVNTSGISINLPAYLTTAMPSANSSLYAGTGVTTTTTAGTQVKGTLATNGLSLAVPAFLTTAQPPGAYLTTAMASDRGTDFVQATAAFAGTNASGTIASNGISVSVAAPGITAISLSDGVGNAAFTNLQFVNSNGVSWNLDTAASQLKASVRTDYAGLNGAITGGSITVNTSGISVNIAAPLLGVLFRDSVDAAQLTQLDFSNANGVSWSLDTANSVIRASVQTNYLTSQSNQAFSASGGSSAFQTLNFANSNGLTFSNSGGSVVASYTVPSTAGLISVIKWSASNDSFVSSAIEFRNGNGVSWSADVGGSIFGSVRTDYRNATDAVGLNTAGTNMTWTVNSSGISINAAGYAGTGTTFNGTNLSGSMTMNSNGLRIDLSAAAPGGGGSVSFSAGTSSVALNSLVFSNANNVSFGLNGSTVTATVDVGAVTLNTYENRQLGASSAFAAGQNSFWVAPFRLVDAVKASSILNMVSMTGSTSGAAGTVGITMNQVIYKQTATASTDRFDSIWSTQLLITAYGSSTNSVAYSIDGGASGQQTTIAAANTTAATQNVWGGRLITFNINSTLDPGRYMYGLLISTSSAGHTNAMRSFLPIGERPLTFNPGNNFGSAIGASVGYVEAGTYSATTGAIPATIAFTQIAPISNVIPWFKVGAI